MGTNYYYRDEKCPTCGRYDERHIGKSSAGWTFNFRGYDDIRSYKDWLAILEKEQVIIYDEYGDTISLEDFKKLVESKRNSFHNHAKEYPQYSWLDKEGNSFSDNEFS